jgi:hypothetical protein
MKFKSPKEKRTAVVLGLLCVGAVYYMVKQMTSLGVGSGAGEPKHVTAPAAPASPRRAAAAKDDELARYDPEVKLEKLKDLDSRPLEAFERNPFDFGLSKQQIEAKHAAEVASSQPQPPPPPPPPPPVTVKAIGFEESKNGKRQAFLSDADITYSVREGESFANRYKLLKITPTSVEVEDESYHQKVQLPYPE